MSKKDAIKLWQEFADDAIWERTDFVDPPYTWECNITLEIDGYSFYGWGYETAGEGEIHELVCIQPDGKKIDII